MIVCKNCGGFVGAKNVSRTALPTKSGAKVRYADAQRFKQNQAGVETPSSTEFNPSWDDIATGGKTYVDVWVEALRVTFGLHPGASLNLYIPPGKPPPYSIPASTLRSVWPQGPYQMIRSVWPSVQMTQLQSEARTPSSLVMTKVRAALLPNRNPGQSPLSF